MLKRLLSLMILSAMSYTLAFAQQKTVSGVVSGEDGTPLIGVTVQVKGTTTGTFTDSDGSYSINTREGAALVFSYIGYRTLEREVGSESIINVTLTEDLQALDELVVTALGITRERKSLGYSVQQAKGEELTRAANPDLQSTLSGKFAGVQVRQSSGMPGAPSQIYIRGARSFSGDNAPLYVVDGMPITTNNDYGSNVTGAASTNRALDIDVNDIESMNVLKGQAAAALYGMRASNGVIIITTKRGSEARQGRPVVSFNHNTTFDVIAKLPEVQTTYAQGTGGAFAPANSFSWGPKVTDLPNDPNYGGNNFGENGKFFDPYKGKWVDPVGHNNPKGFYDKTAYTINNSINISNANSLGNYSVGFGATNQEGIIESTGMDKYNASMAGDFNLAEKWKTGFSGNYSDSKVKKTPSGNDSWLFTVYGAPPSYDLNGTPFHQEGTNGEYRQISYRGAFVNPYWAAENNHFEEQTKRFYGNGYVEFLPAPWVSVKYQAGVDTYTTDNWEYEEMGAGDLPGANDYPSPANPNFAYKEPTSGYIANYGITRRVVNSLLTATFKRQFDFGLNADLVVGNEIDDNRRETYVAEGAGFTTPGWNNLDNTNTQFSSHNQYARRTVGFFGNLNVDYNETLFLNVTGRQDIVSSMPTDNRTFFYPSASLSWVFTELEPLKDNSIMNYGKLRVSYAEVGQAASTYLADPYFVTGGANSGFLGSGITYPWQGVTGYKYSRTIYDPNLKPQNTRTYEAGIELRFLGSRIGLDYSFFLQDAKDQIFAVPLAGSTGYGSLMMNAGQMKGTGHEIVLTTTPVQKRDFEWNLTANFSKLVNEVVELAPGVDNISLGGFTTPNIRASAGDTYPAIYGEQYVRDSEGRILVDEDPTSPFYGMPMIGEFGKIGDVSPDFNLSVINNFNLFRNISVFAQIDWKQGGQMYSGTNRLMDLYGTSKRTEDRTTPFIYDGYLSNGQPNNIERGGSGDPKAYEDYYSLMGDLSEAQIYGTSFVKLREIGINYSLPQRIVNPLKISSASLGFVARNIILWSELPYFDPEASQGQGNMASGMDYMSLPQTSSFGFNLNLKF